MQSEMQNRSTSLDMVASRTKTYFCTSFGSWWASQFWICPQFTFSATGRAMRPQIDKLLFLGTFQNWPSVIWVIRRCNANQFQLALVGSVCNVLTVTLARFMTTACTGGKIKTLQTCALTMRSTLSVSLIQKRCISLWLRSLGKNQWLSTLK